LSWGDQIDVPEDWVRAAIGSVAQLVKDKVEPSALPADSPYIGLEHVEAHSMRILGHGQASDVRSTKTRFTAGDVLYGKLRPYLNKVARPSFDGICSTDFLVFGDSAAVDRGYLTYYLNQLWLADRAHHLSNGVELPRIDWKSLGQLPIVYPESKGDQRAIVDQIDRIGTVRASAATHLAAARRAIERFRQAVLAAACSGRLTADWRESNPKSQSVERALLELSRSVRRKVWGEDTVELPLPDVPDNYVISTVGRASIVLEYGTSKRAEASGDGIPVLRMGNIQDGRLDLSDLKYIPVDREIERLMLQRGDLLFNRTNSPELVGKAAVFCGDEQMTFASYLIRVRFAEGVAEPDFINYWINSAWGKAWARQVKTDGVSQSNINGTKLGVMPVPIPPIEEQREIVHRASRMLGLADGLLARIEAASRGVERSSQAVLAKAFRGELLPTGAASEESDG
jgi:type I restriction enzyme S subunit